MNRDRAVLLGRRERSVIALAALVIASLASPKLAKADAATLTVFAPRAIATVLREVGREFEQRSGYHLTTVVDLTTNLVPRVKAGEPVDVVIALPNLIDTLADERKVLPETRVSLLRSGLGVEVRSGAPMPDVSSVAAVKAAVLAAHSVAYLKTPAGVHLDEAFARLGIADQVKAKALRPDTDIVSESVAAGKVELGIVVTTQILTTPGVALAGRLPDELQYYVEFVGAVSSSARSPEVARSLLSFLRSPPARAVITAQGMEPGQ